MIERTAIDVVVVGSEVAVGTATVAGDASLGPPKSISPKQQHGDHGHRRHEQETPEEWKAAVLVLFFGARAVVSIGHDQGGYNVRGLPRIDPKGSD